MSASAKMKSAIDAAALAAVTALTNQGLVVSPDRIVIEPTRTTSWALPVQLVIVAGSRLYEDGTLSIVTATVRVVKEPNDEWNVHDPSFGGGTMAIAEIAPK